MGEPDDDMGERERAPSRCGLMNNLDQLRDKPLMFLPKLHSPADNSSITSFFIQPSIYFAFFGQDMGISLRDLIDLEDASISAQPRLLVAQSEDTSEHSTCQGTSASPEVDWLEDIAIEKQILRDRYEQLNRQESERMGDPMLETRGHYSHPAAKRICRSNRELSHMYR
jgi:hypothetical protein